MNNKPLKQALLNEDDVIRHVRSYLIGNGYAKIEYCKTTERGIDIQAQNPDGKRLLIEAKGGTPSAQNAKKERKEFSRNQKTSHVAAAIIKSLRTMEIHKKAEIGMAFPDDETHRGILKSIRGAIKKLRLCIFLVEGGGRVHKIDDGNL